MAFPAGAGRFSRGRRRSACWRLPLPTTLVGQVNGSLRHLPHSFSRAPGLIIQEASPDLHGVCRQGREGETLEILTHTTVCFDYEERSDSASLNLGLNERNFSKKSSRQSGRRKLALSWQQKPHTASPSGSTQHSLSRQDFYPINNRQPDASGISSRLNTWAGGGTIDQKHFSQRARMN
jgi:hypothetical protein